MGLVETANNDIFDITSDLDGFGVAIKIVSPDAIELNFVGLHTKHRSGYDNNGNQVNTKNAHISVSEDAFINVSYPYRNSAGEVDLKDHLVTVKDSTRADIQYIIREWFQDETVGNIVCILGDYEQVVPTTPITPSGLTPTLFGLNIVDLAWTDNTGGNFDTYEIFRSENNGPSVLLDTTTNPTSYRDESNLDENEVKFYDYKVRAVKDAIPSLFSNEDGVLTLKIENLELDLDALSPTELPLSSLNISVFEDASDNEADFIQPTEAQQPIADSLTEPSEIVYDSSTSEYLFNDSDIDKFINLTEGAISFIVDGFVGETRYPFVLNRTGNNTARFNVSVSSSNLVSLLIDRTPSLFLSVNSTSTVSEGDRVTIQLRNGQYEIYINGSSDVVVPSIPDDIRWISYVGSQLDTMSIGALIRASNNFRNLVHKSLKVTSKPLSASLIQSLSDQLQVKHSL